MKGTDWLDKTGETLGGASDYRLAKLLGVSTAAITAQRKGRSTTLDDDACIAIAEILQIDPLTIIADQQAERAKTEKARAFWRRVTAAAVVIVSTATGVAAPTRSMAYAPSHGVTDYTLYALRRRRPHRDKRIDRGGAPGRTTRRRIPGPKPPHRAAVRQTRQRPTPCY